MEKAVDLELLKGLWKMYLRQKAEEADAGLDTSVDIEHARGVFNLVARGHLTDDEIEAQFPEPEPEHKPGVCPKCQNTGWCRDRKAKFLFRGSAEGRHRTKTAPGMVLCECLEGQQRRAAIKAGPQRKKKGFRD